MVESSELIGDNKSVICTVLCNVKITTEEDAAPIVEAIQNMGDMVTLNLDGISLGVDGALAISRVLPPTLKECEWGNCFKSRLLEEIPPALFHLAQGLTDSGARIRKLDLSDNAFGPNGARGVRPILESLACLELEEILLNNCGLGVGGGEIIGAALETLDDNIRGAGLIPKLRVLVAGRNRQEVGGSAALARGFEKLKSLEEVSLIQNGITWKGAVALSNAFKLCPMTKINLNDNILTQKGAIAIAEAVECLPNLIELDLGDCLVRTEGALKLAKSLKNCQKIKIVNMAFGEIKIEGAMALMNVLPLQDLEFLDFNGNKFGDEGCEELQAMSDLIGELEDDDGDESDDENEHAVTDSEDEDECYVEEATKEHENVVEELSVGCMKNFEFGLTQGHTNDQYSEPLDSATTVDFLGKGLKIDTAADASDIVAAINSIEKLVTLRLSGNTISPDGAEVISNALSGRDELQHLLLSDIFTGRLKDEIPKAIQFLNNALNYEGTNTRIRTLDLSDNAFGPNGAVAVEPFLNSKACLKLQFLKLNNNGLGTHGAKMIASGLENLVELAKTNNQKLNLKEFICGRNRLEVHGSAALFDVFQKIGTLEVIEVPQNGILPEGVAKIAAGLAQNLNMRMFNMNDNTVTERGVASLSSALIKCKKIEKLDLGDCLCRSAGAKILAEILPELKSLRTLNLSYNELNGDSGLQIAKSSVTLDRLEHLNLNGNSFGDACQTIENFMEKNKCNHKLEPLDEDNGELEEEEIQDYSEDENQENINIKDFLNNPNIQNLLQMGTGGSDEIVKNCSNSHQLVRVMIKLAGSNRTNLSEKSLITVEQTIEKILRQVFRDYDVMEVTEQILIECALLKAEDKKRRVQLANNPPILKNIFYFLKNEVNKTYFPADTKKYLLTFIKRKGVKSLDEAEGNDKSELIARLYKF